jgi:hypothetical protein
MYLGLWIQGCERGGFNLLIESEVQSEKTNNVSSGGDGTPLRPGGC